jgi:CTP synthase (UTP-ammonia lyase)
MGQTLKIAVIGDYNFTYNSHQATNLALDHSARFLEVEVNYYWIKTTDAAQFKPTQFEDFDGLLIAPGPFQSLFFLNGVIRTISQLKIPVLLTGEGMRSLIEVLISMHQLNPNGEKLISENLVDGNQFEKILINPHSEALKKMYASHNTLELTSSRYSLYPQLIFTLTDQLVDVEAYNQFDEPEVISLKGHTFFVACGYCPQISSTREIPHPLIYTFLKASLNDSPN